jgi:type VI secretion system secreted protein VgrG
MYTNHFKAIPASIVYQPPRMTPIPQAPSTQLAIVVGASNAEYNTDQYGRLQVEFFWDLNPKVTKQSVWLRSIAMWEGVLRVGTPVLVGFIDGNINDPVILGPIHQDTLMPINTLEGEQTKSVLVRRHPDASIQKTYNFLSFEDKKDAQLMHLNATKNMQVNVLQDFNQEVAKGTYHLKVKGNMTIETEGQLIVKSKGAMNFTTEDAFSLQAKSIEMKASQGLSASAQTVDVKAGASASIDGGGQMTLKAGIIQQN